MNSALAGSVMWAGGITPTEAHFRVSGYQGQTFLVSPNEDLSSPLFQFPITSERSSFNVSGLAPATRYFFGVPTDVGRFKTFQNGAYNFTLGFSSCAKSGSNSEAFLELYNHNVDLFINTGDLHYEDIAVNDLAKFNAGFDMVFDHANPKNFYRSVAMDYVYDDHDFGPNNADGESPSRPAAQTAYRLNFPHYNLPNTTADGLGAVYHTFSVGRVKFIVIDTRAEQFRAIPQIISPHQMAWLKNELNDFASWGLVVLVSSQPWIGAAEPGVSQAWNGYPAQREELANHIATIGVNNMIFIAGDAHMLAYDNGSNSDYSTVANAKAGFPVFQSASLDRPGSTKGGPYSEGCFAYAYAFTNQYSIMDVRDSGSDVCVDVRGYRLGVATPLVALSVCTSDMVIDGEPGAGSCSIPAMPGVYYGWIIVDYVVAIFVIIVLILVVPPRLCCKCANPWSRSRLILVLLFLLTIILIIAIAVGVNSRLPVEAIFPVLIAQLIADGVFLIGAIVVLIYWRKKGTMMSVEMD